MPPVSSLISVAAAWLVAVCRYDATFWHCRPGALSSGESSTPDSKSDSPDSSQQALKLWDQCGGASRCNGNTPCADQPWESTGSCPEGSTCDRKNQWYYQCRPLNSGPFKEPSPSPSPSPSPEPPSPSPEPPSPSPGPMLAPSSELPVVITLPVESPSPSPAVVVQSPSPASPSPSPQVTVISTTPAPPSPSPPPPPPLPSPSPPPSPPPPPRSPTPSPRIGLGPNEPANWTAPVVPPPSLSLPPTTRSPTPSPHIGLHPNEAANWTTRVPESGPVSNRTGRGSASPSSLAPKKVNITTVAAALGPALRTFVNATQSRSNASAPVNATVDLVNSTVVVHVSPSPSPSPSTAIPSPSPVAPSPSPSPEVQPMPPSPAPLQPRQNATLTFTGTLQLPSHSAAMWGALNNHCPLMLLDGLARHLWQIQVRHHKGMMVYRRPVSPLCHCV